MSAPQPAATSRWGRTVARDLGPDFRRLWSASAASQLGDGVLLAAGPLVVASITSQPAAVAFAVFAQQLPWLLFSLLSGALVDRVDRRVLVVVVDICRAGVLGALALWLYVGAPPLWSIYVALFALGTGETLADNAKMALVAAAVEPSQLGRANSRLVLTITMGNQLIGPPVGALLFAFAAALPIGFNALTFLVAAAFISRIRRRPVVLEQTERPHLGRDVREGLVWLWRHAALRTLALAIFFMNVTFFGAFSTWVLFTRERLGLSEQQFGLLLAVGAIGGALGSLVYPGLERRFGVIILLRVGIVLETIVHLVLALTRNGWVAAITMFLFGIHAVIWGTVSMTVRQRAVPAKLQGRVTSVYMLAAVGGAAIGALVGGLIAQWLGLTAPFWAAFGGMVIITALAWRQLRHVALDPVGD